MTTVRPPPILVVTFFGALALSGVLTGCGRSSREHSAHSAALQRAVVASIQRMAYLEGPAGGVLSNVQCVASSGSTMTCVGYRGGGSTQTIYTVTVDETTGKYIITSNRSKQVETGSQSAQPAPSYTGRRPTLFLDGTKVSGIGPHYKTKSSSITLTGSVAPRNAPLTISGLAASPATAAYGYHAITVANGSFTLTLPVGPGENDFQISQGSEIIVTFAVTKRA
jgi:hypothetical protein